MRTWSRAIAAVGLSTVGFAGSHAGAAATTTVPFSAETTPKVIAGTVTASALPVATALGATLGKPSCPPVEKPRVGLTLQCLIGFGKDPVGWLVTLRADGTLAARPTFPIASRARTETLVGPGAKCPMATFVGIPPGATVDCTVGRSTVTVTMGTDGILRRQVESTPKR